MRIEKIQTDEHYKKQKQIACQTPPGPAGACIAENRHDSIAFAAEKSADGTKNCPPVQKK
jgi:hypothetical protein